MTKTAPIAQLSQTVSTKLQKMTRLS